MKDHLPDALRALTVAAAILLASAPAAPARVAQEDETRGLWDTGFEKKRPKPKAPSAKKPVRYRRATPPLQAKAPAAVAEPVTPEAGEASVVGVTIWRLRPSAAADDATARILVHGPAEKEEAWTPERIEADTPLAEGQRVRLSIESPREGYLYVIDREQYADGSFGAPYLIFPTLRTRGGSNAVSPGAVVEIPGQSDDPPYFTLRRSRPDHVSEEITILVAPQPLDGVTIGRSARELDPAQVADWVARWGVQSERLEMADGAGQTYTAAERAAGAHPAERLSQGDPLPQTLYRVLARPGEPVLVRIPLRIGQ